MLQYFPLYQAKLNGKIFRIDRLFYDLKYGIDLLDEYRQDSYDDEQYEIGNLLPYYLGMDNTGYPIRLDTCQVRVDAKAQTNVPLCVNFGDVVDFRSARSYCAAPTARLLLWEPSPFSTARET